VGIEHLWELAGVAFIGFLTMVSVIAFVHELGHYLVARACGVQVHVFSIGFGRELFGWTDRTGCRWRMCALPLGGYVKMSGEDGTARDSDGQRRALTPEERRHSYYHRPLRQRVAIVLAGPLANLVFAVVAVALLTLSVGRTVVSPEIASVATSSPAAVAGLQPGDRILTVAGADVVSFDEFRSRVAAQGEAPVALVIERGGTALELVLGADDGRWGGDFGLEPAGREQADVGFFDAAAHGLNVTLRFSLATLQALYEVAMGAPSAETIAGPLKLAKITGQATLAVGIGALVLLTALLSVNIAVFNLLPIPALDGGHLVFMAIEKLRGAPLPRRVQQVSSLGGFALVIMLCVFITANDLLALLG
jgi:regulator of sigma E protease